MNAEEIKAFRDSLNLTQKEFAHIVGVRSTTIRRWESGQSKPSRMANKLLAEIKTGLEKARG